MYDVSGFERELATLINRYSVEGDSNTPDFILASYLRRCLDLYGETIRQRVRWYGAIDTPGGGSIPYHGA